MRQLNTLVFNRHDIQKMAIEYAKSLGFIPDGKYVSIEYDPKDITDEKILVKVAIQVQPLRAESQQQVQR